MGGGEGITGAHPNTWGVAAGTGDVSGGFFKYFVYLDTASQ